MNRKRLGFIALLLIVAMSATASLKETVEKDFQARGAEKSVKSIIGNVA